MPLKKTQRSLKKWTGEKWTTPSGKKSSETGEVYAPKAQIQKLKSIKKQISTQESESSESSEDSDSSEGSE